jgi:hypothetical protein
MTLEEHLIFMTRMEFMQLCESASGGRELLRVREKGIAQSGCLHESRHCEEICAPALSKWVIIVSIPIAIGEEEGSRNIYCESCWRGHKSFIFQRLTDELMCFCYERLSAACPQMCSCKAFQSRKKPGHSAVNRRVVGSSPT